MRLLLDTHIILWALETLVFHNEHQVHNDPFEWRFPAAEGLRWQQRRPCRKAGNLFRGRP